VPYAFVANARAGVASEPWDVGAIVAQMRARRVIGAMGERARELVLSRGADRVIDAAGLLVGRRERAAA